MGTGVGEAALAAEAVGAAEAATAGAGFLEGMAGVSALEGAGVAGLGLGTGAGLGAGMAGGLGSLSPAFQTALGETAVFNPEIAAQTAQFANVGAVPPVGAEFGWNPADLATAGQGAGDIAAGQTNWQDIMAKGQQDALKARSLYPGTQLASAANTVSDAGSVVGDALNKTQLAEVAAKYPDLYPGGITSDGSTIFNPAGNAQYSFHPAEKVVSALEARGAAAPVPGMSFDAFGTPTPIGSPAALSADATGLAQAQLDANAAAQAAKSGGIGDLLKNATQPFQDWWNDQNKITQYGLGGMGALQAAKYLNRPQGVAAPEKYTGPLSKFSYDPATYTPYTYKPYAAGGPVEEMSRENALGANTGYPQADINQGAYATPWQTPVSRNVVAGAGDANVDQMTGLERMAGGGIASLGGYSDGGRLLRGPGDGMSDNIPANISGKQPARLADGEFVVPADVVSGLGNGSTEAGAKQLYKMLDKVRSARTGTKKQGKQINPNKYTPA